ncbi:molybdenum cofactor guanylyltransferase MobA [Paludibacterium sp. B53371]|uniref:molybdenum cofactor guanylyltransferase MobA n=1 Tax=Paludibacterium sp. B53371 TaxID=2806263 RepID=UPI001C05D23F|nr:molybdenum cofactor guanylyltransferase MobA [Paludibacterium sp. B53371]
MTTPVSAGFDRPRLAGVVLAGGDGRRMGGCDKGWQMLGSRALVEHVYARLHPQVDAVWISANRSLERYRQFGAPVFGDDPQWTGMGPLAGLATVASRLPDTIRLIQLVPCDTPLLPLDLVRRLLPALDEPACLASYPQTERGPEPLMLLLRREALASLPDYLREGGRSLRGWLTQCAARTVYFAEQDAFANANDPASLQQLTQAIGQLNGAQSAGQGTTS